MFKQLCHSAGLFKSIMRTSLFLDPINQQQIFLKSVGRPVARF